MEKVEDTGTMSATGPSPTSPDHRDVPMVRNYSCNFMPNLTIGMSPDTPGPMGVGPDETGLVHEVLCGS